MDAPTTVPAVRAWRPPVPGVREVLHAEFLDHAYPLHTHDVWTVFIVDRGAIRYQLDGRPGGAVPGTVSILPPHVVHDGRPADGAGYRKRVLYLETSILGEELIGPAVDRPILPDRDLLGALCAVHDALACVDDALEAELRLHAVADHIRTHLGVGGTAPRVAADGDRELAEALRAFLDAHTFEPLTMAGAAQAIGAGPTRLARAFADAFAIPPHAYLTGRRLQAARERILEGQPLADVATAVGFCDQAHLTRRFKRYLGTTPARFARGAGRAGGAGRIATSRPRGAAERPILS